VKKLENRNLTYIAAIAQSAVPKAIAKNRSLTYQLPTDHSPPKHRLDEIAQALPPESFTPVQLDLDKPRTVWVSLIQVQIPKLEGLHWIAIQLNASTFTDATEIDYFLTNAADQQVSAAWVAQTYSQRNWVEVFYREAKGWLGLREYQVRDAKSLKRHWILLFCAYTFILWHQLTGGLRRRWATKPLQTFTQALEAFRTAVEFRFVRCLNTHIDVFAAHRAKSGYVWA
jgi:hypothetical protein